MANLPHDRHANPPRATVAGSARLWTAVGRAHAAIQSALVGVSAIQLRLGRPVPLRLFTLGALDDKAQS